mmetsp:Transcript_94192/g.177199  ORF Transcript_94192/g.177199 Transcript_94192/m.177199 type:complete len:165 (+) Transcript_94192:91-585(+)
MLQNGLLSIPDADMDWQASYSLACTPSRLGASGVYNQLLLPVACTAEEDELKARSSACRTTVGAGAVRHVCNKRGCAECELVPQMKRLRLSQESDERSDGHAMAVDAAPAQQGPQQPAMPSARRAVTELRRAELERRALEEMQRYRQEMRRCEFGLSVTSTGSC